MIACRSCKYENLEMVLDLGMQPWGNHFVPISDNVEIPKYPLELYFCKNCTMVQIGYTIPKELMFVDHNYLSGTTQSLRRHFSRVCDDIQARVTLGRDDYVLDVGGNDGTFLSIFRDKGIKVINVESGIKQANISTETGVPCINKFFNEQSALEVLSEWGPARVIHGAGIFFHLEELHSVFSGIKKLLAQSGVVVAEFIYLPEMVKSCAYDQIYHEHLLYYTIRSFDTFLMQHGLSIYDAELAPIHGGTCIAYITHSETAKKTEALHKLEELEVSGGFDGIGVYQDFAKRTAEMRDELVRIMGDLRSQGKRVHALGAPVKGTTIINYCELTHQDIECAVEINPLKFNTYYPGTFIPVYAQDGAPQPDIYLLLAWNFKDEILPKLESFRADGGRIIIPIPEPHLI